MKDTSLEDCKTAELHRILAVQSHGALIAIDRESGRIVACSQNIDQFLARPAQQLLNESGDSILGPELLDPRPPDQVEEFVEPLYRQDLALNSGRVCVASHFTRTHMIIELEHAVAEQPALSFSQRKRFVAGLETAQSPEDCAAVLMREVARLTNFDRVMLYRFLPEWHGEVIDEQNKPGVPGFLGLRFPGGDIPANARRLYTVNLERSVANVGAPHSPILHPPDAADLDLSWSQLRAVHPVHLTYLTNIGAQAAFSLSIVLEGRLWGMVACHHLEPRELSMPLRRTCEELTRITGMQMTSLARISVEREWHAFRAAIAEIRGSLRASMTGFPAIESQITEIARLLRAEGLWQCFNGRDHLHGSVPNQNLRSKLRQWVSTLDASKVAAFNALPEPFRGLPQMERLASGMLFLPLGNQNFMLAFRPEQVEEVLWAGRSADPKLKPGQAEELTPRTSFLKWAETVRGQARAWTLTERESAGLLRQELIDYLNRCQIERQAHADPLTGLANRLLFDQELERTAEEVSQLGDVFAVLMIDLDKFKPVNDTLGHAAGDELLIQVAQRLAAMVRTEDTVARLGGDEFAVILRHVTNAASAEEIAERMVAEIGRGFVVLGSEVQIGTSIGVALWPADSPIPVRDLLARADAALYAAKEQGRSRHELFRPELRREQEAAEHDDHALREGLAQGQFSMRYQPIVRASDRQLVGFEGFCYWQHPERGELSPTEFRHLMAHQQLMEAWTRWCLTQLFEQRRAQQQQDSAIALYWSVNISAAQFMRLNLCTLCNELATQYNTGLEWLRLDLDEQALSSSRERAARKIASLVRCGVRVNIDHFGRGAILLQQLADLPLEALKFSALEVLQEPESERMRNRLAIKRALGQVLKVPLIATQIETIADIDWAVANGIEYVQGYVISRPLAANQALEWSLTAAARENPSTP